MTREGKIILETGSKVAMAPDGNGGIYPALQRKGALADMRRRGVEHVHVFSIDNALVRVADPHFLGYCIEKKADCGNKSVWKAEPGEKVRLHKKFLCLWVSLVVVRVFLCSVDVGYREKSASGAQVVCCVLLSTVVVHTTRGTTFLVSIEHDG